MATIKVESINVYQIFDEAFTALTQKVSVVELTKEEDGIFPDGAHLFVIKTKGGFQGEIRVEMEEGLMDEIVTRINKGQKMQEAEKILFAVEYLNIVCGRALSEINNQLGNRSRLSIPHYVTETEPEDMKDGESETLSYQSTYGKLKITVIYKVG